MQAMHAYVQLTFSMIRLLTSTQDNTATSVSIARNFGGGCLTPGKGVRSASCKCSKDDRVWVGPSLRLLQVQLVRKSSVGML